MLLDAKGLHLRLDKETEVLEVGHLEWKRSESTKLEFHNFTLFTIRMEGWRSTDCSHLLCSSVVLADKKHFLVFLLVNGDCHKNFSKKVIKYENMIILFFFRSPSSPFLRQIVKESMSWKLLSVPMDFELQWESWSPASKTDQIQKVKGTLEIKTKWDQIQKHIFCERNRRDFHLALARHNHHNANLALHFLREH